MYFRISVRALLLAAGCCASAAALACSCLPPVSPLEEFQRADAVFAGKVVAIKTDPQDAFSIRAELVVTEAWKGEVAALQSVHSFADSALCGFPFESGESYLVYAFFEEWPEGELSTNQCVRTRALPQAGQDLAFLGQGRDPGADFQALAEFHQRLDGENWRMRDGWADPRVPHCDWHGLHCDPDGKLESVSLAGNRLSGELGERLFPLPVRELIDLADNQIHGDLSFVPPDPPPLAWNAGARGGGIDLCWNDWSVHDTALEEWLDQHHVGGPAWRDCRLRQRKPVDPGLSGSWLHPARVGEGLALQWLDFGQPLLYRFTFDEDGNQRWLFNIGEVAEQRLVWPDLADTRGRFGEGLWPQGLRLGAGRLVLDRTGELAASVELLSPDWMTCLDWLNPDCLADRRSQRLEHQQFTRLAGSRCQLRHPQQWMSGAWFNPERSGEGFLIEVTETGAAVVYWFGHADDDSGKQRWWIGQGLPEVAAIGVPELLLPRALSVDPLTVELLHWGELRIEFEDAGQAFLSWNRLADSTGQDGYPLERLARPLLAECD